MDEFLLEYDVVVIGGGPSGMSAAISAKKNGVKKVLLLELEDVLGGALNQCIHSNFGKNIFNHEVSGSEYSQYFIDTIEELDIEVKLNTLVLDIDENKIISYVNPEEGSNYIRAKCIILAMGSREKFNGNANIPLNKFTGIYTVGTAHRFVNFQGYLPGKEIVMLGSTDNDIIVARRLLIEGATIKAIIESSNEYKYKSQKSKEIIDTFNLPLIKGYRLNEVRGKERVSSIIVSDVKKNYIEEIYCDSLLISVDWSAETNIAKKIGIDLDNHNKGIKVNENYETSHKGIFACGNVVRCNSLSDTCVNDGEIVGNIVYKCLNEINI